VNGTCLSYLERSLLNTCSIMAPNEMQLPNNTANMSSNRKKYRKMRMKFDEKMRESNTFFVKEQLAEKTAARIAIQNEFVFIRNLFYSDGTKCAITVVYSIYSSM